MDGFLERETGSCPWPLGITSLQDYKKYTLRCIFAALSGFGKFLKIQGEMDKIFEEMDVAITVCKKDGEIIEMNRKSRQTFLKPGRENLIGKNVLDCHPSPAKEKLESMLKDPHSNAYTIEKNGIKKLIFQTPWYENGEFMGLVEFSMVIPENLPHYIRK